jgi:hypothetical protein
MIKVPLKKNQMNILRENSAFVRYEIKPIERKSCREGLKTVLTLFINNDVWRKV